MHFRTARREGIITTITLYIYIREQMVEDDCSGLLIIVYKWSEGQSKSLKCISLSLSLSHTHTHTHNTDSCHHFQVVEHFQLIMESQEFEHEPEASI